MSNQTTSSSKLARYLQLTRSPTYALIVAVPLFLIYHAGVWVVNGGSSVGLHNAAEVAVMRPFLALGPYGQPVFLLLIAVTTYFVYQLDTRERRVRIVRSFLGLMLVESLVYGAFLGRVVNTLLQPIFHVPFMGTGMSGVGLPAQLVLSFGAGLYEELLFRVILVGVLFLAFSRATRWRTEAAYAAAAVVGAVVFSAYHYIGPYGDPFQVYSFLYRFVAGLLFNILYRVRGFGIVAYTHAFYDVIVTLHSL